MFLKAVNICLHQGVLESAAVAVLYNTVSFFL